MEKDNHIQLELFSQPEENNLAQEQNNTNFWKFIRGFEKTIMLIIAIAVISIISFSLGVEKGKRLSNLNLKQNTPINIQALQPKTETPVVIPVQTQTMPKQNDLTIPAVMPERQKYTIQLASYKTKTGAQKEAELLKKRGFLPFVITKGSFTVLCVGNFNNKEKAQSLLSQLKNRYRGCYIRRL